MPSYHIFSATTAQVPYLYQNFIIPYFPAKEVKPLKNNPSHDGYETL